MMLLRVLFHPEFDFPDDLIQLNCHYFAENHGLYFIDSFIGIWTVFALPSRTAFQRVRLSRKSTV